MNIPDKGSLIYMQFDPQAGHEQSGNRPGIVLSPKNFNQATRFAVVCPITKQKKGYPFEVELPDGLTVEGVVLTDQQKCMDWQSRHLKVLDHAPNDIIRTCINRIQTFIYQDKVN